MLQTYKATLNGDRLEWSDEIPEAVQNEKSVSVFITILEEENTSQDLRPYGLAAGEFVVPGDFDESLPEEVLAGFESE